MKRILCGILATAVTVSAAETVTYNPKSLAPIQLKKGDLFVVNESAIPGAGYGWQPQNSGSPGLKLVSSMTVSPKTEAVGGPVTQKFFFKAIASGAQVLTLWYGRPWEIKKGAKPEKVVTIRLTIH